ncbi:ribonuclease D [Candidatus Puniceispirillum sp.]|uniref:ribonuclease D n=1 Tax=Candidatus Puniceispirillum sp. TaxID=2026719 RepID=UPI003F6960F0
MDHNQTKNSRAKRNEPDNSIPLEKLPPDALITTNAGLSRVVEEFRGKPFLAIDTEFMRERTYYPQLCLIQVGDGTKAVAIDPLAKNLDLEPLWSLMRDESIIKVFHAGNQDMEIFLNEMGGLPSPVYDTQIAGLVCGHGDQIGYDSLVKSILGKNVDKTSRFTDWSKRPLTDRQISYALDDVIYLAQIYPIMLDKIATENRTNWLDEEFKKFSDTATYITKPDDAWKRIKIRHLKAPALMRLMQLAAWREIEAQSRNVPRNRVIRDETLIDLAGTAPKTTSEFSKIRNFPGGTDGKFVKPVLKIIQDVASIPESELPVIPSRGKPVRPPQAVMELLRVLLKYTTDHHNIAPRLIASSDDLELLATDDDAPIRALQGWRREVFGNTALKLKSGEIGLAVKNGKIRVIELS